MRQIFVVYETDAWHSMNHRKCAGVFTSKWAAVNAIVKNHRIELEEFFDKDVIEQTSKRVLKAEAGVYSVRNLKLPTTPKAMRRIMTLRCGTSMSGI